MDEQQIRADERHQIAVALYADEDATEAAMFDDASRLWGRIFDLLGISDDAFAVICAAHQTFDLRNGRA